jgi:hypothetical protein
MILPQGSKCARCWKTFNGAGARRHSRNTAAIVASAEMQKQAIEEEWQLQRNNSQGRKVQDFLDLAARAREAR